MTELVIFDMDGVLIDSEDAITIAALEALKTKWNIDAKYEDFKQFTGMGENKFIGGVAELYGVPYEFAMKDEAYRIYCETAKERVTVYEWSNPLSKSLVKNGFKIAIASAADMVKVKCNLECIGLDTSLFSAIITGSDVVNKKPDPEIFLAAALKSGCNPENSIVIEDAVSGVMAAKAAGMKCIAITSSFDKKTLLNAGADIVVNELFNALDIIKAL